MKSRRGPASLSAAARLLLALAATSALGAGEIKPGAYCPLPKEGKAPSCIVPAQAEYRGFFSGLEEGELDEDETARLERDVAAGADSPNPYLALSSLSYGYYRLAQRVAASEGADPAVVARLERWNAILAKAYVESPRDESYRAAVEEAALDLQQHAPEVRLRCVDAQGRDAECSSTEAVIRGINAASSEAGIEGALERLIRRILGGEAS